MKRYMTLFFIILGGLFISSMLMTTVQAQSSVPLMSKEELKGMLGNPDLIILDTRGGRDWKSSEYKIKDAVRADPSKFGSWKNTYGKDKKLVLYCA